MIKNNSSKLFGERRIKMIEHCRLTGLSKIRFTDVSRRNIYF
ncbi:MAG: hypothetical protein PHV37_08640 [Candidatus Gastranaerophilales bacterium]|nr:hypothetical protein [Candidatus Gastranaerophilales bacterium]